MSHFRRSYTPPGAVPGAVVAPANSVAPKITLIDFNKDAIEEEHVESVADLAHPDEPQTVTWIDVQGLGDGSVVQQFGELLGFHPLAISDVVNVGQRPKVDQYGDITFIVLRMVTLDEDARLQWEQVSLFVGKNYVLTFQETHEDCLEPLRERIRKGRKVIRSSGPDYLACAIVDAIVDGYFPILEHYGDQLEELENHILAGKKAETLAQLFLTKRDLVGFRRASWPLREALAHMMRTDEGTLTEPSRLHLRDTLDHVMQIVEVNESYRELAASLLDLHLSMVGQRTNDIMRVLTVVSAIFIPLTFVAGIYGMNFDTSLPLNLPELRWEFGYLTFWAFCLSVGTCLVLLFRRLGWLRR